MAARLDPVHTSPKFDAVRVFRALSAVVAARLVGQSALLVSTLWVAAQVSPDTFGAYGLFASGFAILGQVVSLRAEVVALACRTTRATRLYLGLSVVFGAGLSAVSFVGLLLGLWISSLPPILLLLPIAGFFASLFNYIMPAFETATGRPGRAGLHLGVLGLTAAVFQSFAALLWPDSTGLILARVGAMCVIAILFYFTISRACSNALFGFRMVLRTRRVLVPLWREVVFALPSALVSTLALQAPVWVFGALGKAAEVGLFWFGFNLLLSPYMLVSASLRPLLLRAVSNMPKGAPRVSALRKLTIWAGFAGGVPIAMFCLIARFGIDHFMTPEWQDAAAFLSVLGLLVWGYVLVFPLAATAPVFRLQSSHLALNIGQLCMRLGVLAFALWFGASAVGALFAAVVASVAIYGAFIFIILNSLRKTCDTSY